MKEQLFIPAFTVNIIKVILIAGVVFLGVVQLFQWNSTNILQQQNKQFKTEIKELATTNKTLKNEVLKDSIKIAAQLQKIDSLTATDKKYKTELYTIKKRYEKLKINYHIANNDERNRIFANLINN
jgi:cell division protein FtsB